jgi:amino acid transporter
MNKGSNKKKFIPENMPRVTLYALIAWCIAAVGMGICALSVYFRINWLYQPGFIVAFFGIAIFIGITWVGVGKYFLRKKQKPLKQNTSDK